MTLGQIAFLGSGETSLAGGRIFESLAKKINGPLRIALMETPAGFELNSAQVVGKVGDFMKTRLQNYKPVVDVVPARKKNSAFSPDDPEIIKPLLYANMIFMGPGSPTYAIRNLQDTLAWDVIRARHRLGATLVFASAATISVGAHALPVYEIYKVGQDVHVVDSSRIGIMPMAAWISIPVVVSLVWTVLMSGAIWFLLKMLPWGWMNIPALSWISRAACARSAE